jgi:hypothetical protein
MELQFHTGPGYQFNNEFILFYATRGFITEFVTRNTNSCHERGDTISHNYTVPFRFILILSSLHLGLRSTFFPFDF